MHEKKPRYWFAAKRYGWGWGLPLTWEGWVVLAAWIVILVGASPWMIQWSWITFAVFVVLMTLSLIGVCWIKGERPRWRWGD